MVMIRIMDIIILSITTTIITIAIIIIIVPTLTMCEISYHRHPYYGNTKNDHHIRKLRLGIILPNNNSLPYSYSKVLPAIKVAIDKIKEEGDRGPLPNWEISTIYRDSECSSLYGPLAAFEMQYKGLADVFFGPVCTYVLAPVARYATVWQVPILSSSGQNDNFDAKHPQYKYLTRMNGSYTQIGHIFTKILAKFGWKIIGLLFHNYDDRQRGNSPCHFNMAAVFSAVGKTPPHKSFDENNSSVSYKSLLLSVTKNSRSKYVMFIIF